MTRPEFDSLKIGDRVRLDFSINPEQTIVNLDKKRGLITSECSKYVGISYTNNYIDVMYISAVSKEDVERKNQILSWFADFRKNCYVCPFKEECSNVQKTTRRASTNDFGLCTAISMTEEQW